MNMEHWWTDPDRGKLKYADNNFSQSHSVHKISHTDRPGIESGCPRRGTGI